MKKPVIWINVDNTGHINETSATHPASPPVLGGVWTVYAPANSNLAEVLARNVELEAENKELSKLLGIALCPQCDGGGAYYDNYGEVCQCQWCDEKGKALQPIPTQEGE